MKNILAEAKGVIDRIIASQSTDVDVISGATYSSNGIIGGVNEAHKKIFINKFNGVVYIFSWLQIISSGKILR